MDSNTLSKNKTTTETLFNYCYISPKKVLLFSISIFWSFGLLWAQDQELAPVDFSHEPGYYSYAFELDLSSESAGNIHYTIDGDYPNQRSKIFRTAIKIKKTTVVRARVIDGKEKGPVSTFSFIIGNKTTFPTISLAIEPKDLFDPEKGLFLKGPEADSVFPYSGANFWSRKEIKINTEIFEVNGNPVFNDQTGMRIFGGMSRLFPQKSLAIVARDKYGDNRFRYPFFEQKNIAKFKYLALRNSGSDWGKTHLKDVYVTDLLKNFDVEYQAYRPSHCFINGKYWGIYNIREKVNRFFLESNTGYDKDEIDLIEHRMNVRRGDKKHYKSMLDYMRRYDLKLERHYTHIQNQMEVESFMDLQIAQIYLDNQDAGGNIKYWRPQTESGRWRWILYDTDWGMGLHNKRAYRSNTLKLMTDPNGPIWPNPPWSTFILRNLLENKSFEHDFINRLCNHMNTVFDPEFMLEKLEEKIEEFEPEIKLHLKRWHLRNSKREDHIERMQWFIRKRPEYMREFIRKQFDVGEDVEVEISQNAGGRILINKHLKWISPHFKGSYFYNIPFYLKAIPNHGYRFSHWEIDGDHQENQEVQINFYSNSLKVRAVFEKANHPLAGKIIINEIACVNDGAGDWVEIYNASSESINLHDWYFLDKKNEWALPPFRLKADHYVVLCRDSAAFKKIYPEVKSILGNFPFGLNQLEERLELYSSGGAPIDSLTYQIELQSEPFTITLTDPTLDNTNLYHWEIKNGKGSPGKINPDYALHLQKKARNRNVFIALIVLCFSLILMFIFMRKRKIQHTV